MISGRLPHFPGTLVSDQVRNQLATAVLGHAPSPELTRALAEGSYSRTVFFIRNLGFVEPTAARRISFEDSLAFERLHERTYLGLGFHLVNVPAGKPADRVALIQQTIGHQQH
jgi:predicted ATPase